LPVILFAEAFGPQLLMSRLTERQALAGVQHN